ncbi:aminoacyl-tRNA hydrolase [Halalkalibacillus sediminis]|uniref:Peptidyl-tRNA hydrolase n=1 Tax=Halalkalibacillus sediminis TaxID=2018042 RepID=A0A2I0QT35_9BACI|nr:aminoacyl-tRNA hydrolase [Halalkalibacillus sediminis]PKR77503.1 aminoacyl-tRNA hydrolase [Halalkalibacillus sediminis]
MKCIVGLGNPGLKYKKTRHNIGFQVIDELAAKQKWKFQKGKFESHYIYERLNGEQILLLKPQTFMNLSGKAIKQAADFYQIEPQDILVIYDDLDLPTGKIRLRQKGGHGGHNGIRSTIDQIGTKEFNRLRFGIGRPKENLEVTHYVLGKFSKEELKDVQPSVQRAVEACEEWTEQPFLEVMNHFNQ